MKEFMANEQINLGANLGQNVGGIPPVNNMNGSTYIPPVTQPVVPPVNSDMVNIPPITSGYAMVVPQIDTTVNSAVSEVVNEVTTIEANTVQATTVTTENVLEPIIKDDFRITTAVLRDIVNKARKVGKWEPMVVRTQVINLTLDKNGITVCTTSGKVDYEHTDRNYSFNKSINVCVDNKILGDVLNNITIGEIELVFDEVTKVLTIKSPENVDEQFSFPLPQRIDISTQQPIDLSLSLPLSYDTMIPFDYNKICNIINQSKPVRAFVSGRADFDGVYFSNLIISSDASIMLMQENDINIKDKNFFVSTEFCEYIATMPFNSNKTRIGFATDNSGNVYAINISDGDTTLCGTVTVTSGIPTEICQQFWNTPFNTKVSIDTKRMCNSLKRIIPFIDKISDDDGATFQIENNMLKVTPYSKIAHDTMMIENPSQLKIDINLSIVRMAKLLQAVKSNKFNITFNPENANCVCLEYDNYKCIVALAN